MLPEAYIAHVSQGRMRIKIPSRKGDRTFFSALKDKLPESSEIPGIQRIEMNPTTGSVLVIYDPDYKMPDLTVVTSFLEQQGLFKLGATGNNSEPPVSRNIAKTFQGVNQKLTGFTSGEIDLQSLAVLGLLGLGLQMEEHRDSVFRAECRDAVHERRIGRQLHLASALPPAPEIVRVVVEDELAQTEEFAAAQLFLSLAQVPAGGLRVLPCVAS